MPNISVSVSPQRRTLGLILGISTVLAVAVVAHHPVAAVHSGIGVLDSIDRLRSVDQVVHGALIGLLLAFMVAFVGFADELGADRAIVRAGLAMYLTGGLAGIGAGVIDGFIIPDLARHFAAAPPDEQKAGYDLIVFAGISIQDLSKLAFILMSGGILCWAATLLAARSRMRMFGAIGVLAGGAPLILLMATRIVLTPPVLVGILGAQSVWNLCVAWYLIGARRYVDIQAR